MKSLKILNLFKVVKLVGGGFLVKVAGIEESPVAYLPLTIPGLCHADAHRGVPEAAKSAVWIKARCSKGFHEDRNKLSLWKEQDGRFRVYGFGFMTLTAHSPKVKLEFLKKAQDYVWENNSPDILRAYGFGLPASHA